VFEIIGNALAYARRQRKLRDFAIFVDFDVRDLRERIVRLFSMGAA